MPLQAHGVITLLKIDQSSQYHQSFTSRARQRVASPSDRQYGPRQTQAPVAQRSTHQPSPDSKQTECHGLRGPVSFTGAARDNDAVL